MKTIIFLFFSLLSTIGFSQTTSGVPKGPPGKIQAITNNQPLLIQTVNSISPVSGSCGTDHIREEAFKQNPQLKVNFDLSIQNIKTYIANSSTSRSAASQYRIPVVIHVIHNGETLGTGTNISDAQIQAQIDRMNSSFDNIGGGTSSVFTDVTFCLAQNGPNGSTVTWPGLPGVNRLQDAQTNAGLSAASQANLMSVINWPSNQYLNIWIVSTINGSYTGVIGYAPQPLTGGPLDGIVIQANVFGDNSVGTYSLLSGYDLGMTMVHEAGHYLGLYHTFQGASCTETNCNTQGDLICDTPPTSIGSTCTTPICTGAQIANYMDYTLDVCKNTYTLGQKNWMHATIATMRSNLVSPANLTLTGVPCAPAGLLATFTQSVSQICTGSSVTFTATTTANTAISFIWTFPGGTPATATGAGPHSITYTTAGDYDVILETNNGTSNLINTSVDAVNVTNCGTGIAGSQAQWYFQQNCAVSFASGVPVGFSGSFNTRAEGSASVCDASGNLEFYTDGYRAWNGTGSITSSLRTLAPSYESPAQGAVIVPDPNNINNYYVFSNPGVETTLTQNIRYSLYEGATQDFPTVINQPPVTNYKVTEHLAAAPHCNGTDYWVIYHGAEAGVNDKFLAYQISASGVSATPVISNAFSVPVSRSGNDWIGQIDIAPNGRLMAATNINSSDLYIYEIDRANGQITLLTSAPYTNGYGVSFSPNSEFLYVAGGSELRQYNVSKLLECGSSVNFETLNMTPTSTSYSYKSLQAGPDGKIYINRTFESWLDVLNYPNQEITVMNPNAVGYNDYAVALPSTSSFGTRISLPNMIDVPLGLTTADFNFCITNCGDVEFHNLGCGNTFSWDFGDMTTSTLENPSHNYSGPGTYVVTFIATTNLAAGGTTSSTVIKTININVPATPSIVGPILVICPTPVNQFAQYTPSPLDPSLDYYWTVTGGTLVGSNPTDVAYVDWAGAGSIKLVVIDPITGCTDSTTINVYCISDTCIPVIPTNLICNDTEGTQVLTWDAIPGMAYQLELTYNDPECCPSGSLPTQIIIPLTTNSYTGPYAIDCFSWRVRSVCSDGTYSNWSSKRCACKPCKPITPTDFECLVSKSGIQTLNWNTTIGLTYQVEIIYNDPFCVEGGTGSTPVIFNVSGGSYTVNVSPITGCLSWRVRSVCSDGTVSKWSEKQCCCKEIGFCEPITPIDLRCTNILGNINLSWASVAGATYEIELNYNDPECCESPTPPTGIRYVLTANSYSGPFAYRCFSWKVRSICPDGNMSNWSSLICVCEPTEMEEGASPTGRIVNPKGGINATYNNGISIQINPNPAKDFVTFRVTAKDATKELGTIVIMNITGEIVYTSSIKLNGSTTINITNLNAGSYIYKVISDNTFKSGKIIIIN